MAPVGSGTLLSHIYMIVLFIVGHQRAAEHRERHGQLPNGWLRLQRGGYSHQVDVAL
jgi:hypothetical protein